MFISGPQKCREGDIEGSQNEQNAYFVCEKGCWVKKTCMKGYLFDRNVSIIIKESLAVIREEHVLPMDKHNRKRQQQLEQEEI